MSDGVFISDRPQLAKARQTVSFASLGLNDPTLCRIIYEVGNPYLSYVPTDEFNPIAGITEGKDYLLYLNSFFDGSPALVNAVLDNLIPQTSTNVFAGVRVVFLCTSSVSFATAGITTGNTNLITLVSEGYFTSYDPNDSINGIDGFVEGELYDIDPITDIDLHAYGVTKIRYSDEVLYLDSLEDVVVTNSNPDATLPLAEEEVLVRNATTGVWENKPVSDLPGGGASDGNNYPTSLTFDSDTGDLTIERIGLTDLVENIDGRYSLISDIPDGVISGCKVIWESGLTFRVTAGVYYIDGVRYELAEGNITLNAADPTNPRFDIIAVNDASAIVKLTGIPAADPSEPQIDPATQLYLTSVLVGAGATVPTGVTDVIIYDENTEWAGSASGTIPLNFASITSPSNGTKSIAITSWSAGSAITFTNGSALSTGDVKNFSLKIKLTATLTKNQNISLQFFNGGTATSLQMPVAISKTIVGSYQTFALTTIDFTGALFDRIKLLFAGSNTNAVYIDEIRYQSGVNQPGGGGGTFTETDPTVPVLVKQIPVSVDAATNKYINWDGSKYIRKQIAYSEVSGTPTIPSAYTDEQAQDAVGTILSSEFTYDDATPQISVNSIPYSKISGTPSIPTQYTDEMAQDATGTILTDTDTIDFTYNDGTPSIIADVKKQMSIASDASGLKLSGDSATPGNSKYYGTDGTGAKGFYSLPSANSFMHKRLKIFYIDEGSVSSVATDINSYNIPANTLVNNGDQLKFEYDLIAVSNANTKTINWSFAALSQSFVLNATDTVFKLNVHVIRQTSSVVIIKWIAYRGTSISVHGNSTQAVLDFTTALATKLSVNTPTNNSVVSKSATIDYIPNA
jgi:hypothetical protein